MSGTAPPFDLELGSGRLERAVAATVWMLAAMATGGWLQGWGHSPPGLLVLAGLGGALFGWAAARPLRGRLVWDGQAWTLQAPGGLSPAPLRQLRLALDLGGALVLRAEAGRWCVVAASMAGLRWHGLQVALRLGSRPDRRVRGP